MTNKNPMCCGSHCKTHDGPVRVYRLSGGANLILCEACFAHENRFRHDQRRETGNAEAWPDRAWSLAVPYDGAR